MQLQRCTAPATCSVVHKFMEGVFVIRISRHRGITELLIANKLMVDAAALRLLQTVLQNPSCTCVSRHSR